MKEVQWYSVLLLYPDYLVDSTETYYIHVRARTPKDAIVHAQENAVADNGADVSDPDDFLPLFVCRGIVKMALGVSDYS